MNHFVTATLGIGKHQDFSENSCNGLVICDGIGQMKESGKIAELVTNCFIDGFHSEQPFFDQEFIYEVSEKVKNSKIRGGTTLIYCRELEKEKVRIGYLGNGGAVHLRGDFFFEKTGETVCNFSNLILPHVDKTKKLMRFISHESFNDNHRISILDILLNSEEGDILIFFSDGLGSLENQYIGEVQDFGMLRLESEILQEIFLSLHQEFCKDVEVDHRIDQLRLMLEKKFKEFKERSILEDDISIGLVITDKVFDYYKKKLKQYDQIDSGL